MVASVSFSISTSYSACEIIPFLKEARQLLTSIVCGKDPIVVVGNNGSFKAACCFTLRKAKTLARCASASVIAATRCFTKSLCINEEVSLSSAALILSNNFRCNASVFSLLANCASVTTSSIFCFAKASQFFIAGGNVFSFVSTSRSQGECISEQEGAIQTLSLPMAFMALFIMPRDCSKLFFQMLRPSTTPKERLIFDVIKSAVKMSSNCNGQRTKSRCMVCTGRLTTVAKFSP